MCNENAHVFYKGERVWDDGKRQNYGSLGAQQSDGCAAWHPPPEGKPASSAAAKSNLVNQIARKMNQIKSNRPSYQIK